ncbi:hypothetical protein FNH08_41110 [Streptomyces spongiae]|uniref:Uncharacterized protein n=1 Tax=Streptomyces spongiae TaxID=565072 RepID=A0A5N8XVC6_9ACTN|nr:hypothetical protein [Streptomyces spongiae]
MAGVITASERSWIGPFTGLSPRCFVRQHNGSLEQSCCQWSVLLLRMSGPSRMSIGLRPRS